VKDWSHPVASTVAGGAIVIGAALAVDDAVLAAAMLC